MRTDLTINQVRAVVLMLHDMLGEDIDDDRLVLDTLEAETDLHAVCSRLLAAIETEEGKVEALKGMIATRNERKARAEAKIDSYRAGLRALMEAAGVDKLPLPEATVTLRNVAPKPVVIDSDLLPDALCKITRRPDMAAIKAIPDVTSLPGLALDNGGVSLTIRRR